jgi:hypothetical protein
MEDCGRIARGDNSLFVGEIFPDISLNFPVRLRREFVCKLLNLAVYWTPESQGKV